MPIILLFKGLLQIRKIRESCKDDKPKGILRKLFLVYLWERSFEKEKIIKNIIYKEQIGFGNNILIYSFWFYDYAKVAINLKEHLGLIKCKTITRAHGYDLYEERNKVNYIPLRKNTLKKIDAVFVCSKDGENYLKSKYIEFSKKIYHNYLGTEDGGIENGDFSDNLIVSCSRVAKVKRVELIVDILVELRRRGNKIKWVHIGDGKEMRSLKKKCKEYLFESEYSLLGEMGNEDVHNFYSQNLVKYFINVSAYEGIPISIMEAISYGIPVFATNVGGVSEIVTNSVNGLLFDANSSIKQIVDEIEKYLNMPPQIYLEYRKNARNIWESKFCLENNINSLLNIMETK